MLLNIASSITQFFFISFIKWLNLMVMNVGFILGHLAVQFPTKSTTDYVSTGKLSSLSEPQLFKSVKWG